jgi:lactoylglutathione lyase
MRIEHMAVWSLDIEVLREFYERWFGAASGPRYENPSKGFASYFLSFEAGPRLELMQRGDVTGTAGPNLLGYAHLAIALGSEEAVDRQTAALRAAGVPVVDGPRRTGDGYYESVVEDPDGNRIELTC